MPIKDSDQGPPDIVWGTNAIAAVIGRNQRQTFWMLEKGHLPARKVGGKWVASRKKLLEVLGAE
jgi:hypothetical protein